MLENTSRCHFPLASVHLWGRLVKPSYRQFCSNWLQTIFMQPDASCVAAKMILQPNNITRWVPCCKSINKINLSRGGKKNGSSEASAVCSIVVSSGNSERLYGTINLHLCTSPNKNTPTTVEGLGQQLPTWPSPVTHVRASKKAWLEV